MGFVTPPSNHISKQLSLNKVFDPSSTSMRKGRDGKNGKKEEEKKDVYSGN